MAGMNKIAGRDVICQYCVLHSVNYDEVGGWLEIPVCGESTSCAGLFWNEVPGIPGRVEIGTLVTWG